MKKYLIELKRKELPDDAPPMYKMANVPNNIGLMVGDFEETPNQPIKTDEYYYCLIQDDDAIYLKSDEQGLIEALSYKTKQASEMLRKQFVMQQRYHERNRIKNKCWWDRLLNNF